MIQNYLVYYHTQLLDLHSLEFLDFANSAEPFRLQSEEIINDDSD